MEWGRLISAMATPFAPDMSVDYVKVGALAEKLVSDGNTAIIVCGTTGESPNITREERIGLIKEVKARVKVPVISGAGTNSTATSIANAKDSEAAGADGVLLVAPYYNKPDQGMMYAHFSAIAAAIKIPVILYNVPGRTASTIAPATVARLAKDHTNIVALKDASGDLGAMTETMLLAPKGFRVYTGEDGLLLPSMAIGAYGVVSVASHVVGKQMAALIAAFVAGKTEEAGRLHRELFAINKALFLQANPVPLKAAMKLVGFDAGGLRLPLLEASPEVVGKLKDALSALGLI
jgi:4-hydroxy-tetrahydrodipicolinate synthase